MWDSNIPSHESTVAAGYIFGTLALEPPVTLAAFAEARLTQAGSGTVKRVGIKGSVLWREKGAAGGPWEVFIEVNGGAETIIFPDWSLEYDKQQSQRVDDLYVEIPGASLTEIVVGLRHASPSGDPITVILPCFVLEEIDVDDTVSGVTVENRFPYPNQTQVPHDLTDFKFDLTDYDGSPPPSSIVLYLNDVVIHSGGTDFFGVTDVSVVSGSKTVVTVTGDGTGPFAAPTEDTEWTLRVVATGVDESWSFTTTNNQAPSLARATYISGRHIRVEFSEAMEGGTEVLLAGAYDVSPEKTPAYPAEVISVSRVNPRTVVLTLDDVVTFGIPYRVTVADTVTDASGQAISQTNREYVLSPLVHIQEDRVVDVLDGFPEWNQCTDPDGDLRIMTSIIKDMLDQSYYRKDSWQFRLDCVDSPIEYVELILKDLGNCFTFEMTEAEKRLLVCFELSYLQELVGTEPGIEAAILFFLGIDVELEVRADHAIWVLGDAVKSVLGATTVVAPALDSTTWITIWFRLPAGVTLADISDEQHARVAIITKCMFAENAIFGGIIE